MKSAQNCKVHNTLTCFRRILIVFYIHTDTHSLTRLHTINANLLRHKNAITERVRGNSLCFYVVLFWKGMVLFWKEMLNAPVTFTRTAAYFFYYYYYFFIWFSVCSLFYLYCYSSFSWNITNHNRCHTINKRMGVHSIKSQSRKPLASSI